MVNTQALYFIFDTTHQDFPTAKAEAEISQSLRVPGSLLSWGYNHDQTKGQAKIIGDAEDWYKNISWFGHPMVIDVYAQDGKFGYKDHSVFASIISSAEWNDQIGSPIGGPA